ncbi:MAG: terminase [Actinomycetota bacterium]|nr:terminase [Actinomycetota bacterium]
MRPLSRRTSLGHECIRFAEDILGLVLMPWQRWFLEHALELHPTDVGEDGAPLFRFRKVILLVGRQNGKSTVMQALTLWRMFVDRCSLVIGTAQDLEVAESLLRESYELAEEADELSSELGPLSRGSGKMSFRLRSGETYKVKAASRRGGRGLSGELVLLDELREHQSWDAWGAVTKTTNARERAQIYGISNAGDASSLVLRYLRKMAHGELGDPDGLNADEPPESLLDDDEDVDDSALGIFEWSASPGSSLTDRDAWAQANPALGYRIRESTLSSDARTDPEWIFRTEVLCQWSDGSLVGPFPPDAWERSADVGSRRAGGAAVALCVDVSWDRSTSHIGLASMREDGNVHVEVVASRTGTEWVGQWLTDGLERSAAVMSAPVAVQAKGAPAASLIVPLREAGVQVVEWGGSELGAGTGAFYDKVRAAVGEGAAETGIRHRSQPILNLAAANAATKDNGDAWWWDRRKSAVDVAPLIAVTGAAWCLASAMPTEPAKSAYETRGVLNV